ncbi:ISAs1 family transposase [Mesorhizobium sp. ASY16-5R]|uniref:ISAs1 family transposase n=1 Tax=Mesorhizobium sp. ASY16-5R TaxID=3445772 RepID=UPI003FA11D98
MSVAILEGFEKSRLKSLLDYFGDIEDPREPWRVAHPLPEVLFLVVCGTICDCEDYDLIADWGAAHLDFLRRYLPYHHGVPGGRWLTILMNRIDPALFSECFTAWVRETWPDKPDFIAIDGKTSRRSHDRSIGRAPLHLVSAFATTQRLVLGQEAVCDKSNETTAIPVLLERLAANDGLKGALVSIDAIATNATIATAVRDAGADYLLAVKANQPTLRRDIERYFNDAPDETLDNSHDLDKGHGRIEERSVTVSRETDWLSGDRRFPGELRLPGATTIIRVSSRAELKDRCRFETRYYISSATLSAERAAHAVRGHWLVENALHWTLDVVFKDDQSRLRKGHGAHNMAIVRHFAINLVRAMKDNRAIKRRRKVAGWDADYLASILGHLTR